MLRKKQILISSEGRETHIEWFYKEGVLLRYGIHRNLGDTHRTLSLHMYISDYGCHNDILDKACDMRVSLDDLKLSLYSPFVIPSYGAEPFAQARNVLRSENNHPSVYIYMSSRVGSTEGLSVPEIVHRITRNGSPAGVLGPTG